MPTISDAKRAVDLADKRQKLKAVDVPRLTTPFDIDPFKVGAEVTRNFTSDLRALLCRERDAQIAALDEQIAALGFDLDAEKPAA